MKASKAQSNRHQKTNSVFFKKSGLDHRLIFWGFFVTTLFEAVLAILQFVRQETQADGAIASFNDVEYFRPQGTFSHPDAMGGFYFLVYAFFLTRKVDSKYLIFKYLLLLFASVLILLSFSKLVIFLYLLLNLAYLTYSAKKIDCTLCLISRGLVVAVVSVIFLSAQTDPTSLTYLFNLQNLLLGVVFLGFLLSKREFRIS